MRSNHSWYVASPPPPPRLEVLKWFNELRWKIQAAGLWTCLNKYSTVIKDPKLPGQVDNFSFSKKINLSFYAIYQMANLCFPGEDTMTGDGGEYLRAEDLRELGDDSLPGHYLDGFSYMSHNLDRSRTIHTVHTHTYITTQKHNK